MALFSRSSRVLKRIVELRHGLKTLDRIAAALEAQNGYLQRLADQIAPIIPPPSAADLKSSGPSFSRDYEQVLIQEFQERFYRVSGREPTEEEVVEYLEERARAH